MASYVEVFKETMAHVVVELSKAEKLAMAM
jgi:hypothetical protein